MLSKSLNDLILNMEFSKKSYSNKNQPNTISQSFELDFDDNIPTRRCSNGTNENKLILATLSKCQPILI